jgi:hypothetical protein
MASYWFMHCQGTNATVGLCTGCTATTMTRAHEVLHGRYAVLSPDLEDRYYLDYFDRSACDGMPLQRPQRALPTGSHPVSPTLTQIRERSPFTISWTTWFSWASAADSPISDRLLAILDIWAWLAAIPFWAAVAYLHMGFTRAVEVMTLGKVKIGTVITVYATVSS